MRESFAAIEVFSLVSGAFMFGGSLADDGQANSGALLNAGAPEENGVVDALHVAVHQSCNRLSFTRRLFSFVFLLVIGLPIFAL